jgi:LysM repeat protein
MKSFNKSLLVYIILISGLYSCSVTSTSNTIHTQHITISRIAQEPQMADYTLTSNTKITGKAEGEGSIVDGPTVEMVKREAIYNALKANGADVLVHGTYKATVTDMGKKRHIEVEVSGFPGKYISIRAISVDDARVLVLRDSIRQSLGHQPTHDDSVWLMAIDPDIFTLEALTIQPSETVRTVSQSSTPASHATVTQPAKKMEVSAPAKKKAVAPPKAEPVKSEEPKPANSDENTGNGPAFHKVADGETLSDIATQFGVTIADLKKWNDLSGGLTPGMELVVGVSGNKKPTVDKKPAPVAPVAPVSAPVTTSQGTQYHIVAPGETLYHISVMFKTTVKQIRDWNNLPDNNISVGQNLVVGK